MKKGTCHYDKLVRLRRIEGQVRAIQKMIEKERYCVDILNTVGAAIGALKKVESSVLKDHINACVKTVFEKKSQREKQVKLEEIYGLLEHLNK